MSNKTDKPKAPPLEQFADPATGQPLFRQRREPFPAPPAPTPQPVIDAVMRVAQHLRDAGYGSCVISPSGGASFHRDNVVETMGERLGQLAEFAGERERVLAATGQPSPVGDDDSAAYRMGWEEAMGAVRKVLEERK